MIINALTIIILTLQSLILWKIMTRKCLSATVQQNSQSLLNGSFACIYIFTKIWVSAPRVCEILCFCKCVFWITKINHVWNKPVFTVSFKRSIVNFYQSATMMLGGTLFLSYKCGNSRLPPSAQCTGYLRQAVHRLPPPPQCTGYLRHRSAPVTSATAVHRLSAPPQCTGYLRHSKIV